MLEFFETHWPLLVTLMAAWGWQNVVHEGSHLIAVWKYEGKKPRWPGIIPYPHFYGSKFYWARCMYEPYFLPGHPMVHAAPIVGAAVQGMLAAPLLYLLLGEFMPVSVFHLLALVAPPMGDMLWWMRSLYWGRDGSDGQRFLAAIRYTPPKGSDDGD